MHISEITVNRPVLSIVLSLFVVLIGLASYDKLTIREYPDVDRPVITVKTVYTGASSKVIERDITEIIEDSLSGISGIAIQKRATPSLNSKIEKVTKMFKAARPKGKGKNVLDNTEVKLMA